MDHAELEKRPPRWPWYLLVVMSLASFGGPFVIWMVLRGGESPDWPPDRLIEWVVFVAIVSLEITLFALCLALAILWRKDLGQLVKPPSTPRIPPARAK
jgi:hypothetical protein